MSTANLQPLPSTRTIPTTPRDVHRLLQELHAELPGSNTKFPTHAPQPAAHQGESERKEPYILIIDDEPINIKVMNKYLSELGYTHCRGLTESRQAITEILRDPPDLIILDIVMPHISGLQILEQLRQNPTTAHLPVLILTAAVDRETRLKVLELGATDFVTKPIDPSELSPRVRNALTLKKYHDSLRHQAENLELAVRVRTAELEQSRHDVIYCLARAAEFRDDDTGRHVMRVGRYAGLIAEALGLGPVYIDQIRQAAQLHDIGKIGIPDSILLKTGKLEPEEITRMRKHTYIGKRVIDRPQSQEMDSIRQHVEIGAHILDIPRSPVLQMAARIALTHHEWWDGSGYPIGLAGEDIPLEGRITAVADVYDALSSRRPYKPPYPREKCFEMLRQEKGTHFDPDVLEAFFTMRAQIIQTQLELSDDDCNVNE